LCQGSAIPDGDGNSPERRRGGEQEAGAPETPLLRWVPAGQLVYRQWTGTGKFADRHELIKVIPDRNLFPGTTSMVDKGAKRYRNWDLKIKKICFLANLGVYN
jgi:hypothetical protein